MSAPEERSGRERRAAEPDPRRIGRYNTRTRDRRATKGTRADRKASAEPARPRKSESDDAEQVHLGDSSAGAPVSAPEQEGPDVGSPEDLEGWAEWVEGVRGTEPAELFAECSRAMMTAASRLRAALDERSEPEETDDG